MKYPLLAKEILMMATEDQRIREMIRVDSTKKLDTDLDRKNAARLREIILEIGWPTIARVGKKASHAAWLIVQHAVHDLEFQKQCLALLKKLPEHDFQKSEIVYLEDRIRVAEDGTQQYGTQFYTDQDGELRPRPIDDIPHLDTRRLAMGLEPFADYEKKMKRLFGRGKHVE